MKDSALSFRDKFSQESPAVEGILSRLQETDYQTVFESLSHIQLKRSIFDELEALRNDFIIPNLEKLALQLFNRFTFQQNQNIASVSEGGIMPDLIANSSSSESDLQMDCKLPTFMLCYLLADFCKVAIEVDRNPLDMNHPSALIEFAGKTFLVDFTLNNHTADIVIKPVVYPIAKLQQFQPRLFLPFNAHTLKFFDLIYLMFIVVDLLERSRDSKQGSAQRQELVPLCESIWQEMQKLYPNCAATKFYSTFAATAKTWDE